MELQTPGSRSRDVIRPSFTKKLAGDILTAYIRLMCISRSTTSYGSPLVRRFMSTQTRQVYRFHFYDNRSVEETVETGPKAVMKFLKIKEPRLLYD